MKTSPQSVRVGDRVRLPFGLTTLTGTKVEDRGFIGIAGRRLWRVKGDFDGENTGYTDIPESDLTAVN
jgi:hypothetical protein